MSISLERAALIRSDIEHILNRKWVSGPTLRTLAGKLVFISLKKSWDWSLSRVYSPLWPIVPSPLTKALGTPSFGFSWPTAGLLSCFARNYLSATRLGSFLPATPTPPSTLTSPPSFLYILGLESRSRW
jgi:hypothetical protein